MLTLVGATIAWMLARLDWQELGQRLIGASPTYLALMLAVWMIVLLIRPLRFQFLVRVFSPSTSAPYGTVWAGMMFAATANSIAPMRGGDALMILFLRQRLGIDVHQSFSVIIADLACDFICVATVFAGALSLAPAVAQWANHVVALLVALLIVAAIAAYAAVRYRLHILSAIDRVLARLRPGWRTRGVELAEEVMINLVGIGRWRIVLPLVAITAVIWALTAFSYWLGLRAFLVEPPVAAAAFNMSAVALSFAVPLGPGGLGAFEASSVLALSVFDIPLEVAISTAVIGHIFQLGSALLFTGLAALGGQIDLRSLRQGAR